MVGAIRRKEPLYLLGKALEIHLKHGAAFYFKVTEAGQDFIRGFDDEGLNLQIYIVDIDEVIEL